MFLLGQNALARAATPRKLRGACPFDYVAHVGVDWLTRWRSQAPARSTLASIQVRSGSPGSIYCTSVVSSSAWHVLFVLRLLQTLRATHIPKLP